MGSDGIFMHIFLVLQFLLHNAIPHPLLTPAGPRAPPLKFLSMTHTFCCLFPFLWQVSTGELLTVSLAALPSLGECLDSFFFLTEVIYSGARP